MYMSRLSECKTLKKNRVIRDGLAKSAVSHRFFFLSCEGFRCPLTQ